MKVDLDLECLQIILELNAPKSMLSDGDVAVENSGSTSCRKSLRRWTSKNSCHLCVALVHGFVSFQNAYRLHITIDALLTPYIYVSTLMSSFLVETITPTLYSQSSTWNQISMLSKKKSHLPVCQFQIPCPNFERWKVTWKAKKSFGHISILSLSSPV